MIPDGQRVILTVECACEKVPTGPSSNAHLSDHIEHTELLPKGPKQVRGLLSLFCPVNWFTSLPDDIANLFSIGALRDRVLPGFFVAEGKLNLVVEGTPRAVAGMYACANHLRYGVAHIVNEHCSPQSHRQKTFRGALTNSLGWVFVIHYLNFNGHRAAHKHSGRL